MRIRLRPIFSSYIAFFAFGAYMSFVAKLIASQIFIFSITNAINNSICAINNSISCDISSPIARNNIKNIFTWTNGGLNISFSVHGTVIANIFISILFIKFKRVLAFPTIYAGTRRIHVNFTTNAFSNKNLKLIIIRL